MRPIFLLTCALAPAALGFAVDSPPVPVSAWASSEDGVHKLSELPPLQFQPGEADGTETLITVDPSTRYQSMLGMGASFDHATCENLSKLSEEKRYEVILSLVDPVQGIGMNLMRLCIGASDFIGEPYYSYDDLPAGETDAALEHFSIEKDRAYLLPAIKAAQAANPDLLFFASPWSPPGWMKTTGNMNGGKLLPEYQDAYARYLLKYLQAYAAEQIPIHAMTLQNEPQHVDPNYPTTLWTGEQQRDFIINNMGPALSGAGLATQIWCWDHNWNYPDFPRAVMESPEASRYVQGSAWHFYEGQVNAQTAFHEAFPEKDIYFTEGSTFRSRGALQIIAILRNWARSYNAWVIMLDEHRKPNRGPHSASATALELKDTGEVEYRFDYYMYGQFMKFIPRGAVRVKSEGGQRLLQQVAFVTPDNRIVLVVANAGGEAAQVSVLCNGQHCTSTLPGKTVVTYTWPLHARGE